MWQCRVHAGRVVDGHEAGYRVRARGGSFFSLIYCLSFCVYVLQDWGTDLLLLLFVRSPKTKTNKKKDACVPGAQRGWQIKEGKVGDLGGRSLGWCLSNFHTGQCIAVLFHTVFWFLYAIWQPCLDNVSCVVQAVRAMTRAPLDMKSCYNCPLQSKKFFFFPRGGRKVSPPISFEHSSPVITRRVNWLWPPLFRRGLILLPALILMWSRSNRISGCWLDVRFYLFVCFFSIISV